MITPEQRRKMESEWSSDEQSIVRIGRLARAAVLLLMILGLAWIGGHDASHDPQDAAATLPAFASHQASEASAVQPSRVGGRDFQRVHVSQ
jgi:hypothetical protein